MNTPEKSEDSVTVQDLHLVAQALGIKVESIKSISIELHQEHGLTGSRGGTRRLCYCGGGRFSSSCC